MNNIFAVYKPKGPTSHDIVYQIKRITGEKRVGHAGTLDPLASGVLVIGVGRDATKQLAAIVAKEKEYIAKIKLGEESTTDDEEGEKTPKGNVNTITKKQINNALATFQGIITQIPPSYSAVKIKGKPAYRYARKGQVVDIKPRRVEIKQLELLRMRWPYITIKVITGPGVYIRSLARDIGRKIGTGAYLAELERTRVGEFTKENSTLLAQLQAQGKRGGPLQ